MTDSSNPDSPGGRKPWAAPGRSDLWLTIVVGSLVVLGAVIAAVMDVLRLIPNRDVPVSVLVPEESVDLPLGPGGSAVRARVESAWVTVAELPTTAHLVAVANAVVPKLIIVAVTVCVIVLCRNLLAGRFFSRTNTWLITAVGLTIGVGWLLDLVMGSIVSNWILAIVGEREPYERLAFQVDLLPLAAALGVGALAAAFYAGERMQRDSEGLV